MRYIIDTSVLIDVSRGKRATIDAVSRTIGNDSMLYITLFNFIEFYFGELNRGKEDDVLTFLNHFKELTLSRESAKLYAALSKRYRKKGKVIAAFDLLIAAIAIEHNMLLVTKDNDFSRIDELKKVIITERKK